MSSVYKLRIHKWAAKVPINLCCCRLAQQVAVSADWVYDLILWLRNGRIDRNLPARPSRDDWQKLYIDHRRVTQGVADQFPALLGSGKEV